MPILTKELPDIEVTIECRFTLKHVCDMIIAFSVNVHVFKWQKFGYCSISMWKLSQLQSYKDLTRKTYFLKSGLGSGSIICDWYLIWSRNFKNGQNKKFQTSKRVKPKTEGVFRANPNFWRNAGTEMVGESLLHPV